MSYDISSQNVPQVPEEHLSAVEEALADLEAGIEEEMTSADWDGLRQIIREAATRKSGNA